MHDRSIAAEKKILLLLGIIGKALFKKESNVIRSRDRDRFQIRSGDVRARSGRDLSLSMYFLLFHARNVFLLSLLSLLSLLYLGMLAK